MYLSFLYDINWSIFKPIEIKDTEGTKPKQGRVAKVKKYEFFVGKRKNVVYRRI